MKIEEVLMAVIPLLDISTRAGLIETGVWKPSENVKGLVTVRALMPTATKLASGNSLQLEVYLSKNAKDWRFSHGFTWAGGSEVTSIDGKTILEGPGISVNAESLKGKFVKIVLRLGTSMSIGVQIEDEQ